jgi:ABC-type transport system involved in cytochrome c biogenesis ATPase subunit
VRLGKFSRGMLRRFGLAQAWIGRPALLLLDEPTAGLDAQGFEVLEALLAEAFEQRSAVVLASHLLSGPARQLRRARGAGRRTHRRAGRAARGARTGDLARALPPPRRGGARGRTELPA